MINNNNDRPAPDRLARAYRSYLKAAFCYDVPGGEAVMPLAEALPIVNRHMSERGLENSIPTKLQLPECWDEITI